MFQYLEAKLPQNNLLIRHGSRYGTDFLFFLLRKTDKEIWIFTKSLSRRLHIQKHYSNSRPNKGSENVDGIG